MHQSSYLLQNLVTLAASKAVFVPPCLFGHDPLHYIRLFTTNLAVGHDLLHWLGHPLGWSPFRFALDGLFNLSGNLEWIFGSNVDSFFSLLLLSFFSSGQGFLLNKVMNVCVQEQQKRSINVTILSTRCSIVLDFLCRLW